MVVRLEGKINGEIIIFKHITGDEWEAIIPKNLSGIYIVELVAYDEAGNRGYATKYLVTINPGSLKTQIQRFEWQCSLIDPIVSQVIAKVSDYFSADAKLSCYKANTKLSEYVSQVIGWG